MKRHRPLTYPERIALAVAIMTAVAAVLHSIADLIGALSK